ncbi:MAG: helix-turn-helix domain-containing protein [Treponema sp.]
MIKIHLSKLLGERRMSQKRLAELTDIRRATINEMYHELVERVNLDYLSRICKVLNIKIDDLLEYISDKKKLKNTKL